jgi:hypothetical protein
MRRSCLFVLLAVMVLLVGCATAPSVEAMKADAGDFKLPAGPYADYATVYVVRPSTVGFAIRFSVYVGEKKDEYFAGSTKGNQFIHFAMAPGTRTILSQAENLATCTINAEKGKIYFIQQVPKMGVLFARNDLAVISEIEGKYWVKRLNPGTPRENTQKGTK